MLFWLQACRGASHPPRLDQGVRRLATDHIAAELDLDTISQSECLNRLIPSHADFLQAYATIPNYAAIRNESNGSWFIQDLVEEFESNYKRYHLQDMLTNVNGRVTQRVANGDKMQQPVIINGLNGRVYFAK